MKNNTAGMSYPRKFPFLDVCMKLQETPELLGVGDGVNFLAFGGFATMMPMTSFLLWRYVVHFRCTYFCLYNAKS